MKKVMVGCVVYVKRRIDSYCGGYLLVSVPELNDRIVAASDARGPLFIEAGDEQPIFSDLVPKKVFPGDEVVMEIESGNNLLKVTAWGLSEFWKKAEEVISKRPVYRVLRTNNLRGTSYREEEFFTGSLKKMIQMYPRDGLRESTVDKLAPVYKTGPIVATSRFEVKKDNLSNWEVCADPRPFPKGQVYRVAHWKYGQCSYIAQGTALEIAWKFPRGINGDRLSNDIDLSKFDGVNGLNEHVYWERFDENVPDVSPSHWTEVADPRPLPPVVKKLEVKKTVSKPGVLPKKTERPFKTTLHSLLDLATVCAG